jgi:hypothetical protein
MSDRKERKKSNPVLLAFAMILTAMSWVGMVIWWMWG